MEMKDEERTAMAGLVLTPELIEAFLEDLKNRGRVVDTIKAYRHHLNVFYDFLPKDKSIQKDTLSQWKAVLMEDGFAIRTVNLYLSAAKSLLEYCNRRDLQVSGTRTEPETIQPELTRTEYLRLLSTARNLENEQTYLLVKVFATTGISIRDLPKMTIKTIEKGRMILPDGEEVRFPECIQAELLDFAKRNGICEGPLFITRNKTPIDRNGINRLLHLLAADACVDKEKANTRCLRRLYLTTQKNIQANLALLMEQTYDRLLEKEQASIGWNQNE